MPARKVAAKPAPKLTPKRYRLLKFQPLQFILNVGHGKPILVFDESMGINRAIRHCPGEKSIYVDEQSPDAVVEPIVFSNGFLDTLETDVITQRFLEAGPKYGVLYELIDEAGDAAEIADMEETKLDIKQAIRNKSKEDTGEEEMRIVVSVLTSDAISTAKMTLPELKNSLYSLVEDNPSRFLDDSGNVGIFDDVKIKRAALAQHAFNSGVIKVSVDGGKIMWTDNKATICLVPMGQNHVEFFSEYLSTDDGIQVVQEISKR
jgi:hypothetical protein